jgi:magnesium-protoporphyrin IX monomethyl ester (oxidative) cyclase
VLDVENPKFKEGLDRLCDLNSKVKAIQASGNPVFLQNLQLVPIIAGFAKELLALYMMRPIESGSTDMGMTPQLTY